MPYTGGEKEILHASLHRHRDAVLWKLDGLDDEQVRRVMTPSGTSLLGLVKHLASVEYSWFCSTFGREVEPLWFDPFAGEDMSAGPGETTARIVEFYGRATTWARRGTAGGSPCAGSWSTWSRRRRGTRDTWTSCGS